MRHLPPQSSILIKNQREIKKFPHCNNKCTGVWRFWSHFILDRQTTQTNRSKTRRNNNQKSNRIHKIHTHQFVRVLCIAI